MNIAIQELAALPQWILWKYENRKGKQTKVPYQVCHKLADTSKPETWATYQAVKTHEKGFSGIGFVFCESDPYIGIDLDHCRDPETGTIAPWAKSFIDISQTYSEISPSQTGVKMWLKGNMPDNRGRRKEYQSGAVEMYAHHRYFAVTLSSLHEPPLPIAGNQSAIDFIYNSVFRNADIIEKAKNALNGGKFSQLWEGNTAGYLSHSEADLALCNLLAFWTNKDATQIDALFRQSGLYREDKWERTDYRNATIAKAIQLSGNTFNAAPSPPPPVAKAPKMMKESARNSHLKTVAKSCWARRMERHKILICLQLENKKVCAPPLSDEELASLLDESRPHLSPMAATDILDADFPEPKWAVPGLIPQGLTLVVGKSKLGKSRFMLGISVAVALGGKALGSISVEAGDVLYCALEDNAQRIQDRLVTLCQHGERPNRLYFLTYGELPGMANGGFDLISSWLENHHDCRMIVIDTLQRIRPASSGKRNLYEEDYDVVGRIQQLAMKHKIALVCVHHTNKSRPDYILDEVSGSTGVVGAADTIIILKQTTDGYSMSVMGRDVEATEKAMRFEDELWYMIGDQAEHQTSEARSQIIDLLTETGEPMTVKEIASELRKNEWTTRNLLRRMVHEKQITKAGTRYLITQEDKGGELL